MNLVAVPFAVILMSIAVAGAHGKPFGGQAGNNFFLGEP
jgi:hypothetical protein